MESPLQLLQSVITSKNESNLPGIVNFCSETKFFCNETKEGPSVAHFINSLLAKAETSSAGLTILQSFIPQCPRDVLNSNIISWIQHCNKTLIIDGNISTTSFELLGELIRLSRDFPEVRKEIALSIIPKCLDHFIREAKSQKQDVSVILQCLVQTLETYGKSSGAHKNEITSLVFLFLESSPQNVHTCAKCYLNLAACGSPGQNSENYASNWFLQEKFLINTLHTVMDSLFENIDLHQDAHTLYDVGDYKPPIPNVTEKSLLKKKQRLATQFQSISEYLSVLLMGSFSAAKKIHPESILNLIWRGLSTNCSTLKSVNMSADVSNLLTVISRVNLSCLKLLNALITTCRMNLISYSSFICRILTQTLNWINVENWPYGIGKPHKSIRVEVYNCTTNWLSVSRACSGINKHIEDILSSVISDINVEPPALTLKVPTGKGKNKKHKHKKEVSLTLEHIVYKEEDKDICKAALELIPTILSSTSTVMKPEQHKLLQEVIVSKLLRIQHSRSSNAPIPYSDESCRLSLYKALLSLCNYYHPSFPPPNNFATTIFSKGMKDSSIQVLTFCVHALNTIGKILKPPFTSLEYQITQEGLNHLNKEKYLRETRKRVHNVNNISSLDLNSKSNDILNSTEIEAMSETSLQDFDKSVFCADNEAVDKHGNIQINNENEVNESTEIMPASDSFNQTIDSESFNQSNNSESFNSDSSRPVVILDSEKNVSITNSDSVSGNEVETNGKELDVEQSNESEKVKKRNLEDIDNSLSKKIKMNGVREEEHFLTVEDSDDEMLSSFVDEVNDE
nr:proline-, glutamic acid- and leucine-rich protein 1-like isoform X1 [Halyomorpha halys]